MKININIIISLLIFFVCHFLNASPGVIQLAININDKTCFSFFPGDEHVSFYLKNPENWKTFPVGFNSKIHTSFGVCDYTNRTESDCCEMLGFKLLSHIEAQKFLARKDFKDHSVRPLKEQISNSQASAKDIKFKNDNSFFEYRNWLFSFYFLYALVFLFVLFKIFKKIHSNDEKQIERVALKLLVLLKLYPLICALLALYQSYSLVKSNLSQLGIIGGFFLGGLNVISVLFLTSITVLFSLIGVLYRKEMFFIPLLLGNLYFSFYAHVLLPKIFKLHRDTVVVPARDKEKQLYSEQMKAWPRILDISRLPEQVSIVLRDDKKVEFKNLFPIKIYLTLQAKNLSKNKPLKYDPQYEFCQLAYDVPLNPHVSAAFETHQCIFPVEKQGLLVRIRSDIGYSAISKDEN